MYHGLHMDDDVTLINVLLLLLLLSLFVASATARKEGEGMNGAAWHGPIGASS